MPEGPGAPYFFLRASHISGTVLEVPGNADPAHTLEAIRTAFTKLDTLKCPVPEKNPSHDVVEQAPTSDLQSHNISDYSINGV